MGSKKSPLWDIWEKTGWVRGRKSWTEGTACAEALVETGCTWNRPSEYEAHGTGSGGVRPPAACGLCRDWVSFSETGSLWRVHNTGVRGPDLCFKRIILLLCCSILLGFPGGWVVKNPPANARDAGDAGSIPGWRRSPGGGNGNPLQYSCWENCMDRGAWRATVHGVAKNQAQLSTHVYTHSAVCALRLG